MLLKNVWKINVKLFKIKNYIFIYSDFLVSLCYVLELRADKILFYKVLSE